MLVVSFGRPSPRRVVCSVLAAALIAAVGCSRNSSAGKDGAVVAPDTSAPAGPETGAARDLAPVLPDAALDAPSARRETRPPVDLRPAADRLVARDGRDGSACSEVPYCINYGVNCPAGFGANVCARVANQPSGQQYCCRSEYVSAEFIDIVACFECNCDSQCPANLPYCERNACVECATDGDCPSDRPCCNRTGRNGATCGMCPP